MLGDVQVSIILEHTGKLHAGVVPPVKLVKVLPVESQGDLLSPVTPEVEEDHAVAVGNGSHRLAIPGNDEGRQVLVDAAGLGPVGFNGFPGGSEHPALALDVGSPALFHHGPVGFVPVHGHLHPAAAGGDGVVATFGVQLSQGLFQHIHILQSGGGRHVTAVQQDVAVGFLHAFLVGLAQQGDQVMDIGMDVAVGQQAQEVHGLAGQSVGHQVLPGLGGIERPVFNGLAHQLGALRINLAAAKGVVAHLGVAHVIVAGQTDGGAVGFQVRMGAGGQQMIQRGGLGYRYRVAAAAVTFADTVHDNQYNGFFHKYIPPKYQYAGIVLQFIVRIILHHFFRTYNCFFIFSVPNKKTSGKSSDWVIFPEVVKKV